MTLGAFTIRHGFLKKGSKRAYLLTSDGTNSKVYTTPNLFATPRPTWTAGAQFGGVYEDIREGNVDGEVMVYGPQNITFAPDACMISGHSWDATSMITFDFSEGQQGWGCCYGNCQYTGTGWRNLGGGGQPNEIGICYNFGGQYDIRWIEVLYTVAPNGIYGTIGTQGGGELTRADASGASPICTDFFNNNASNPGPICSPPDKFGRCMWPISVVAVHISFLNGSFDEIQKINFGVVGAVPATPHRTTTVRNSSDHGMNFGSAVNVVVDGVGAVNGFDIANTTSVSYAAGALAIKKASTLGGAYSLDQTLTTNPGVIEIPWSKRNSTALDNTGASPEYIFGLLAADGSSHSLFWVVGGTPVNITPVIGGQPGLAVGPDCITTYLGKYIAALLSFSGTTHLVTSKDAGATWTDRGAVNAAYIRVRRLATRPGQFYIAGSVFDYTNTFGATLISKSKPGTLLFFEAYS